MTFGVLGFVLFVLLLGPGWVLRLDLVGLLGELYPEALEVIDPAHPAHPAQPSDGDGSAGSDGGVSGGCMPSFRTQRQLARQLQRTMTSTSCAPFFPFFFLRSIPSTPVLHSAAGRA